jgi:NAD(P)H-hydrate epimerase
MPARRRDAHKGDFGHVLVVAGSPGMTGAAALAAMSAARTGSGLVTVACPRSLNVILEVKLTEPMTLPVDESADGGFAESAFERIFLFAERCDAVALGPGVGRSGAAAALVRRLYAEVERPIVLDADGLNAFAESPGSLAGAEAPVVLTPHPGEAARLLGCAVEEVQSDREGSARKLAALAGAVAALKGAGTVVTDGARVYVNRTGNPGMASGGMGDVLTGIVASLLGQGMDAFQAACLGVYLHGLAGDIAARKVGEAGLLASDVMESIPAAIRRHAGSARRGKS